MMKEVERQGRTHLINEKGKTSSPPGGSSKHGGGGLYIETTFFALGDRRGLVASLSLLLKDGELEEGPKGRVRAQ